jgi:hypothetical protein
MRHHLDRAATVATTGTPESEETPMTGLGVLAVGLVLCFVGMASAHLAVLASGFALGWLVAEALGAELATLAVVAIASAVVAWVVVTLVLRTALFVVGAVAGGVIGAKLFGLLQGGEGNVLLALLFVLSVAALTGLAAQRFRQPVLAWACAFGGAGLALSGLARILPDALGFLRAPATPVEATIAAAAWVALAVSGWSVQRRWTRKQVQPAE